MSTMWWRLNEKLCGEESSIKLVLVKYSFPSSIPLRSAVYMGKSDMYTSECVCVFVCVRLTLRVVGICHCPWELGGWEGLGWMHVFLETRLREILWQGNNLCSFKEDLRRGKKKKRTWWWRPWNTGFLRETTTVFLATGLLEIEWSVSQLTESRTWGL